MSCREFLGMWRKNGLYYALWGAAMVLMAKARESTGPQEKLMICGHPESAVAGGPTTWYCSMCGEEME